jgi:hypothetical protein
MSGHLERRPGYIITIRNMAVILLLFLSPLLASAADTGITIQTTQYSSYPKTYPLSKEVLDQVKKQENSDSAAVIGNVLRQLRDGDVLVLSVHSNPNIFGLGTMKPIPWSNFWSTFQIDRPPRLASVIIAGCMSIGSGKGYIHATQSDIERLRSIFNAKTLFAPGSEINPLVASNDTKGLVRALFAGKKLGDINLQDRWYYTADQSIDKSSVALKDLRGGDDKELKNCLCRCLEPEGGRFKCRYDLQDRGNSPSCREFSNGPCFCQASGCFRKKPPTSGKCYDVCMKRHR